MAYFEQAFLAHGDEIAFLMVDSTSGVNETHDKAVAFLLDGGYSFRPLFDTKGSAARAYSLSELPQTYAQRDTLPDGKIDNPDLRWRDKENYLYDDNQYLVKVEVIDRGVGQLEVGSVT